LRASVQYEQSSGTDIYTNQWFWHGPSTEWSGGNTGIVPIKQDGQPHVYWTLVPIADAGQAITGLRFDPVNGSLVSTVRWIELDVVK
jgi:hypothetical protein